MEAAYDRSSHRPLHPHYQQHHRRSRTRRSPLGEALGRLQHGGPDHAALPGVPGAHDVGDERRLLALVGRSRQSRWKVGHLIAMLSSLGHVEMLTPLLGAPTEQSLMLKLAEFPDMLGRATAELAPHDVAFYLRDLSAAFHAYYAAERFLVDDLALQAARVLALVGR